MIRYQLIGAILLLQACASPIYYARQVHGQVVDDETEKPLEDAIIVAQWILFHKGLGESWHKARLRVVETVTDKKGHYTIPGSPLIRLLPFTELDRYDPKLSIFKKGYRPTSFINKKDRSGPIRSSDWNGKFLRLKRPPASIEKQANKLGIFFNGIYKGGGKIEWRHFPRMLLAMYEEIQRFDLTTVDPILLPNVPDINKFSATDKKYLEELKNEK
jgi:hypothetical protein